MAHMFLGGRWNNDEFEVPEASGHRAVTVVSGWASGKDRSLYLDKVEWPHNKVCARKALLPSKH